MSNHQVLTRLHLLGFNISNIDIETLSLENNGPIMDYICNFLKLERSQITKSLLKNYKIACENIKHISFGSACTDIQYKLIDTLASAKRCFTFQEYLACLQMCAMHCEMLTNFICIINKDKLNSEILINNTEKEDRREQIKSFLSQRDFYDFLYQPEKINWLSKCLIINKEAKCNLFTINGLRIKYFHRWQQGTATIESDSLKALQKSSNVSASYLELFNNSTNIELIKKYLDSKDG